MVRRRPTVRFRNGLQVRGLTRQDEQGQWGLTARQARQAPQSATVSQRPGQRPGTRAAMACRRGWDEDSIYFDHSGECRDPETHRHCPGRWRGVVSLKPGPDGQQHRAPDLAALSPAREGQRGQGRGHSWHRDRRSRSRGCRPAQAHRARQPSTHTHPDTSNGTEPAQLTGTQHAAALLPISDFPAG